MTKVTVQEIDCVWDAGALLGEGPLYDPRTGNLLWLDIKGEKLFSYGITTGEQQTWSVPGQLSALGLREAGGYVATTRNGFHTLDLSSDPVLKPLHDPEADQADNRFNDGKTDPFGGFWAGTMDDAEDDDVAGSWWRMSPEGNVTLIDCGFHVTNGPAFDLQRERVYFTDSARQTIYKADYRHGNVIANKTVFKTFGEGEGYPDGMSTDKFGNVWVAFWDGWCLRQISPGGDILQTIDMPVPRPTSIALVDDTLYVTSASVGLTDQDLKQAPLSGGLFALKLSENIGSDAPFYG